MYFLGGRRLAAAEAASLARGTSNLCVPSLSETEAWSAKAAFGSMSRIRGSEPLQLTIHAGPVMYPEAIRLTCILLKMFTSFLG